MSTKIYTGFRFIPTSLPAIMEVMGRVKPEIEALQKERFAKLFVSLAVLRADRAALAAPSELSAQSLRFAVRREILDRQRELRASMLRDPAVDLEVVLTCWYVPSLNGVIGFVSSEFSAEVLGKLKADGAIQHFDYWDNTDRDPDVSEEEWAGREAVWAEVLDRQAGPPFSFRFDGEAAVDISLDWEFARSFVEPVRVRAARFAADNLFELWVSQSTPEKPHRGFGTFQGELMRDCALREELAQHIEEITKALPSEDALSKMWHANTVPLLAAHTP
jgi:hypothetical protein